METFYCIDCFDLNNTFPTPEAVALKLQNDYEPTAYVYVYRYGADGSTTITYRGYARGMVTALEQYIMDASTAVLGNRFNQ